MPAIHLVFSAFLGLVSASAFASPNFQQEIDSAFAEILQTKMGRAVCREILGSDEEAIVFHLGVSVEAAAKIARDCKTGAIDGRWVSGGGVQDLRKMTVKVGHPRKYVALESQNDFPIESWTNPYTNTTDLIVGPSGITHERLIQLLAHEMAVYFDSKANPAHPDAESVPELRELRGLPQFSLVAVSDPLVAHSLTFVRALQVEFVILEELVAQGRIPPPADFKNPRLTGLIGESCAHDCILDFISLWRSKFLSIGLPLLAFAPHFRAQMLQEIPRAKPDWTSEQWTRFQETFNSFPVVFLKSQTSGNVLSDLKQIFELKDGLNPNIQAMTSFLAEDVWALERPALATSQLPNGQTLLRFMKQPLLSGSNVSLSSGPRVRVGSGNVE